MKPIPAPVQERSRLTYQALLDCAERLLTARSFNDISLSEICRGINCTTGAFYHRFASKEALLLHLEDRLYERAGELVEVFREAAPLAGRELLRTLITDTVDFYVKNKGSIRALTLAAQSDPELSQRLSRRSREVMQRGSRYLGKRFDIRSRDSERSIEFAVVAVRAVLREVILFGSDALGEYPRDVLISELVELFTRYLGLKKGGNS